MHEAERFLYCDHIEERGEYLFRLACKRDLEGIVAKRKFDPYLQDNAKWYKVRNRSYAQRVGREKLFEGSVPAILTGTTGTCVHQQVISSPKLDLVNKDANGISARKDLILAFLPLKAE